MAKPAGPLCNLRCAYCFYLEKERLFSKGDFRMSDAVLEAYVRQYIESQPTPEVHFAWQGGEPTLLGVEFFKKAVALQKQYAGGKRITNAFQTNGTLLDDAWGAFLAENQFLVGLSIDGPAALHDCWRVDRAGEPSFERVMRGLRVLQKHAVEFNALTVVHRKNSQKPLEVYWFLKEIGVEFMQFIPLVERLPDAEAKRLGLELATPPDRAPTSPPVTPWSVQPRALGEFLCAIFDEWVKQDVGQIFVQIFDMALAQWAGQGATLCVFAPECGSALALEHNGDLYACDHYVYGHYKLGNLLEHPLSELAALPKQRQFGRDKREKLPSTCLACPVRFVCNGDCPKHRFLRTPQGEPGLSYLCAAYKRFFTHIEPAMRTMCELLHQRRAPAEIMNLNNK